MKNIWAQPRRKALFSFIQAPANKDAIRGQRITPGRQQPHEPFHRVPSSGSFVTVVGHVLACLGAPGFGYLHVEKMNAPFPLHFHRDSLSRKRVRVTRILEEIL